jgi:hypothetical protein
MYVCTRTYRTGKVPEEQIIEIWETGSMRLAFNLKAVSQIQRKGLFRFRIRPFGRLRIWIRPLNRGHMKNAWNFCLCETGTVIYSGYGSGSGSNIKWNTRVKKVKKSKVT